MTLTLVHPARQGQDPPVHRSRAHAPALSLSPEETQHLRASIRNLARARYGTIAKLARALEVPADTLSRKTGRLSPGVAVALWRVTAVPLEELLRGKLAALPGGGP